MERQNIWNSQKHLEKEEQSWRNDSRLTMEMQQHDTTAELATSVMDRREGSEPGPVPWELLGFDHVQRPLSGERMCSDVPTLISATGRQCSLFPG